MAWFELRYQLKSPVFWVGCLIFFLLTFGAVTVDQIQIGSRGNVNINSPFAILQTLAILSLFMIFVVVAIVAKVVIRDDETGFAPILRATRSARATICSAASSARSPRRCWSSRRCRSRSRSARRCRGWTRRSSVPGDRGTTSTRCSRSALPTLLIVSATFFALATATRSMMWTYVGAVALLVLYLVMRGLARDARFDDVAALAEPFGLSALSIATKYWTAAERNTLLPPLTGALLANRLIWAGVGLALFAVAYRLFRFEQRSAPSRKPAGLLADDAAPAPRATADRLPHARADAATRRAQLWRLARFDMAFVFRSPAFFVLLGIGMFNAGGSLWYIGECVRQRVLPGHAPDGRRRSTARSRSCRSSSRSIYAGELVWRDRDRRMHEIVDATAAPDWAYLVPKILAIALVLLSTLLVARADRHARAGAEGLHALRARQVPALVRRCR